MIPRTIDPQRSACELVDYALISLQLATRLTALARLLPFGISIISGHRTPGAQRDLFEAGRPTADPDRSTHLTCPATGADVQPHVAASDGVKMALGQAAILCGLRWGGGSPIDPRTGIPTDWNHLDLGPRPS